MLTEISSRNSSVLLRTSNIRACGFAKYLTGSATSENDFPPPAAPPYSTSCSVDARNLVCGPGLGSNITFCLTTEGATLPSFEFDVVLICGETSGISTTKSFFFDFLALP